MLIYEVIDDSFFNWKYGVIFEITSLNINNNYNINDETYILIFI